MVNSIQDPKKTTEPKIQIIWYLLIREHSENHKVKWKNGYDYNHK